MPKFKKGDRVYLANDIYNSDGTLWNPRGTPFTISEVIPSCYHGYIYYRTEEQGDDETFHGNCFTKRLGNEERLEVRRKEYDDKLVNDIITSNE